MAGMKWAHGRNRFLIFLLLLLLFSALLRFTGISKEPFWLDEVCTYNLSSGTIGHIFLANARDTHPPLYYLEIAAARGLFGDSEFVLRSVSVFWGLVAVLIIAVFGRSIGGSRTALMAGLLAAVNPLAVYYAQEARMYAQASTLMIAGSYFLWRWFMASEQSGKPSWKWAALYGATAILLCATHLLATIVLLTQGLFALVFFLWNRRWRDTIKLVMIGLFCIALVGAWSFWVIRIKGVLIDPAILSWIPRISFYSGFRFLAHLFFMPFCSGMSAEIRSGFSTVFWVLVLILILAALWKVIRNRHGRPEETTEKPTGLATVFLLWLTFGPVFFALLWGEFSSPVYYPAKFGVFVVPPFVLICALVVSRIRFKAVQSLVFAFLFSLMFAGYLCQAQTISKTGFREFSEFWKKKGPPDIAIFVPNSNTLMASYYLGEPISNATRQSIEKAALNGPQRLWICADVKGVGKNSKSGDLADWARSLGKGRELTVVDRVRITEIPVQQMPPQFPILPDSRRIDFASENAEPFLGSGWYRSEKTRRWSKGTRAELFFSLGPTDREMDLVLNMSCFHTQEVTLELNGVSVETFRCSGGAPHQRTITLPSGILQKENRLSFLLPDATSPAKVSTSRDTRILALAMRSLEFVPKNSNHPK